MLSSKPHSREQTVPLSSVFFGNPFRFGSLPSIKSQADGYDDPTLLVGSENEKELARARKVMGSEWVLKVKRR